MIKRLRKILRKKYNYELDSYKICLPELKKNKLIKPLLIVFGVVTALFIIQTEGDLDFGINFISYFVAFILLVALPIGLQKDYMKEALIVTPELFIQRLPKNEYIVIEFDKVTGFQHDDEKVIIIQGDMFLELPLRKYGEQLVVIIDILEAKGKTFDKEKDFMVRPVLVAIENDEVIIKEIKEDETIIEKLTKTLMKEYSSVTPGFLKKIILKNGSIDDLSLIKNDLYIKVSHFQVLEGHPENTAFNTSVAKDCILVFTNFKLNLISKRPSNDRLTPFKALESNFENLKTELLKSVFSEWKYSNKVIDYICAAGVGTVKINFNYDEVLIGWNIIK